MLIIVAVLVAACSGSSSSIEPAVATSAASSSSAPTEALLIGSPTVTAVPTMTATPAPVVTDPPVTAPPVTEPPVTAPPPSAAPAIGVPLTIGDQQLMTVLAAELWPGTSSVKPRSGKTFFTVSIRIDATALTSWDSADFKLKDAAGKSYLWRVGRSPHLYDGANLTFGNNYVGWITYEIPKTSLVGLTLIYKPHFLGGTSFAVPVS